MDAICYMWPPGRCYGVSGAVLEQVWLCVRTIVVSYPGFNIIHISMVLVTHSSNDDKYSDAYHCLECTIT